VAGIRRTLERPAAGDLAALETVPPVSPVWRWLGWGIPAAILGGLAWIGWTQGPAAAGENAAFWFLANAVPSGIGAVLALAHPATVVAAALSAPFTSLTPVIGAGYVSAFVQTWFRPPVVAEFRSLADDVSRPAAWWRNRLLRIFLVFVLTTLGSLLGTWVGGVQIARNAF
jgi:pheromone shutdown protein TraB